MSSNLNRILVFGAGIIIFLTMMINQPSGLLVALVVAEITSLAATQWFRSDFFQNRAAQGACLGIIVGLTATLAPTEWKTVAWLIFAAAQMYFVRKILSSRQYSYSLHNALALLLSLAIAGFFGYGLSVVSMPWVGVMVGEYIFAVLFRLARRLGPKTHSKRLKVELYGGDR